MFQFPRLIVVSVLHDFYFLVCVFNPFEKYKSKWEFSPNTGETQKSLKPPPAVEKNYSAEKSEP